MFAIKQWSGFRKIVDTFKNYGINIIIYIIYNILILIKTFPSSPFSTLIQFLKNRKLNLVSPLPGYELDMVSPLPG